MKGGPPGSPDEDGDRFIEIWNLVFMQYEQISKEKRIELPKPSVDTGMGLERMTAVLQGTHDNYKIDHFQKIMAASSDLTKTSIDSKTIASHRVIADHLRASSFLIAEGILPSNEGRGYVLRRIMRRGMRHAHSLGSKNPIFYKLFEVLLNEMQNSYPELINGRELIVETLKNEEEKFSSLLVRGMKILDENLNKVQNKTFPGLEAFKLYDTYGFPFDLTQLMARENNLEVDEEGFHDCMRKQKEKAKLSGKFKISSESLEWISVSEQSDSAFIGYDSLKSDSKIIEYSKNKEGEIYLVLDQTPFYAESGGQVADIGKIIAENITLDVIDVKNMNQSIVHICKGAFDYSNPNVHCTVEETRRNKTRNNHTATHLMHKALKNFIQNKLVYINWSIFLIKLIKISRHCFSNLIFKRFFRVAIERFFVIFQNNLFCVKKIKFTVV